MDTKSDQMDRAIILLNGKLLGIALGLFSGAALFLMTIFLVVKGGPHVGEHLNLLSAFFPGYSVSYLGSLIGFGYAFVTGFISGLVLGTIYNKFARP